MKSVWRERKSGSSGREICADVFETVPFSLFFPPLARYERVWDGYLGKEAGMLRLRAQKWEVQRLQSNIVEDGHGRQ